MSDLIQKQFHFDVKAVADDGSFEGYASVFGNTDSDGEVIDKGAFTRTLAHKNGVVPILWQHDRHEPIGWNAFAEEDDHGLKVKGRLMTDTAEGKRAQSFLKMGIALGAQPGLSIGFMVPKNGDYMKDGVRHFKEVAWKEYSIVTFPSNTEATVISAKGNSKTQRVAGVDLPASCFAYVGDPDKPETWKLPIKFPGNDAATKAHLRNALARFSQTQGIPDSERDAVLAKIKKAASAAGISVSTDDKHAKDYASALGDRSAASAERNAQSGLWAKRSDMEGALQDSIHDTLSDDDLSDDDKKAAINQSIQQHASDLADWFSDFINSDTDDDVDDDYTYGQYMRAEPRGDDQLTKDDNAAAGKKIVSAMNSMKEAQMHAASMKSAHSRAIGTLQSILPLYYANDVNLPNPAGGKGDAEQLHSLLEVTRGLAKSIRTQQQ